MQNDEQAIREILDRWMRESAAGNAAALAAEEIVGTRRFVRDNSYATIPTNCSNRGVRFVSVVRSWSL